jgi:hypothetical protein
MILYVDMTSGREIVALEVRLEGVSIGWAAPNDIHAFLDGAITAEELVQIARSQPAPPEDATVMPNTPARPVERVDIDDPTGYDAGRR